jgi:hypothetical protein
LSMPYEIVIDEENEIVVAYLWRKAIYDECHTSRENTIQSCVNEGYKRLPVDLRDVDGEGIVTTMGAVRFGELLAKDNGLRGVRIVHLLPVQHAAEDSVRFLSNVAAGRCIVMNTFATQGEARKWLFEKYEYLSNKILRGTKCCRAREDEVTLHLFP